jgi:hypothetical protein
MRNECETVRVLLALRAEDWSAQERHQVEAHLVTCPDCAALARLYAEQDRLIRSAPHVRLTASQRGQLLSRVQRERRRKEMITRTVTIVGTAAAALVLIALGLGLYGLFQVQEDVATPVSAGAAGPAATVTPAANFVATPELSPRPSVLFPGAASGPTEPVTAVVGSLVAPTAAIFADEVRIRELAIQTSSGNPVRFALESTETGDTMPRAKLHVPADIRMALEWVVMKPPTADWHVFVHLLDDVGELVMQSDHQVDWSAQTCTETKVGTTCFVTTHHEWEMPASLSPGLYAIRVGLYDPVTAARAPVTDPADDGSVVTLGQIVIPESWIFADEIRSLDAGSPIPFTIGELDPMDPTGPGRLTAGAAGRFLLDWQVVAPPSADWRVFVHLVNEMGDLAFQSDVDVDWPEEPCPAGDPGPECTITTGHDWSLPDALRGGLYTIVAGLYDPQTGMRAPVTSPGEFTLPQVELGYALVLSAPAAPDPALVTLLVFSGRPNPVWTLTEAQEAELLSRMQDLSTIDQPPAEIGGLGYSGFALRLTDGAGVTSERVEVRNGVVRVERDDQVTWLADEERALELWLFEQSAQHIDNTIFDQVRREVWPELSAALPTPAATAGTEPRGEFAIYLAADDLSPSLLSQIKLDDVELEAEPILASGDILRYSSDTHEIDLTPSARERLQQLVVSTAGRAFVIMVGDTRIYAGGIWTPASSQSYDGVVIQVPPVGDSIRIQLGYPESPELFTGQDPRSDPMILGSFAQVGKLE